MKNVISRLVDTVLCGAMHALTVLAVAFLVMPLLVVVIVSFNSTTVIFPPRDWSLVSYMQIPRWPSTRSSEASHSASAVQPCRRCSACRRRSPW